MPARIVDGESLKTWVLSEGGSTTVEQYAIQIRRFLRDCSPADLASVKEEDLVRYACGIIQEPSRRKMISGLVAFFGYLTRIRAIPHDPARYLSRLVRNAMIEQALVEELQRAGISAPDARQISWRDVAAAAIAGKPAPRANRLAGLDERLRRTLVAGLLAKLNASSVDDLNDVLDALVINYS